MRFVGKFTIQAVKRAHRGDVGRGETFHQYTPSGTIVLTVDNPALTDSFDANLGKTFYGEFTLATD